RRIAVVIKVVGTVFSVSGSYRKGGTAGIQRLITQILKSIESSRSRKDQNQHQPPQFGKAFPESPEKQDKVNFHLIVFSVFYLFSLIFHTFILFGLLSGCFSHSLHNHIHIRNSGKSSLCEKHSE